MATRLQRQMFSDGHDFARKCKADGTMFPNDERLSNPEFKAGFIAGWY